MNQAIQTKSDPLMITEQASWKGAELIAEEKEIILLKLLLIIHCAQHGAIPISRVLLDWLYCLSQESSLKLRVSILGGGCHGFQYRFAFTTQANADDIVMEQEAPHPNNLEKQHTVTWLVDMISLNFLRGAVVDFKNDLQGERFIIRGLKAKTTCSCGSSFDVDLQ